MPGFSRKEQARLAHLVLAHRGKLAQDAGRGLRGATTGSWCSRCASRRSSCAAAPTRKLPFLRVAADPGGFAIDLPQSWLDDNPLVGRRARGRGRSLEGGRPEARGERPVRQEGLGAKAGPVTRTARTTTWSFSSRTRLLIHHRPPFFRLPAACARRQQLGQRAPEVGLVADDHHRALVVRPAARLAGSPASVAPGASVLSVLIGTPSASAVCCARTAGLEISTKRAGRRCSSHCATRSACLRPFARQLALEVGHAVLGFRVSPEDQVHGRKCYGKIPLRTARRVAQLVRAPP